MMEIDTCCRKRARNDDGHSELLVEHPIVKSWWNTRWAFSKNPDARNLNTRLVDVEVITPHDIVRSLRATYSGITDVAIIGYLVYDLIELIDDEYNYPGVRDRIQLETGIPYFKLDALHLLQQPLHMLKMPELTLWQIFGAEALGQKVW